MARTTARTMPTNLDRLTVYVDATLKEKLEKLASIEDRSMSQMAVVLIKKGIREAESEGKL